MLRPVGCERDRLDALAVRHLDGGAAQAFADLLGISAEAFDRMHHGAPEPRTARLLGHTVHEEMVSLARRRAPPRHLECQPCHRLPGARRAACRPLSGAVVRPPHDMDDGFGRWLLEPRLSGLAA
jgi:hypothetical protein